MLSKTFILIVLVLLLASLLALAENLPQEQKTFLHNLKKIGATRSELDTLSILLKTNAPQDEVEKRSNSIIQRRLSRFDPEQQKVYYDLKEEERLDYLASSDPNGWVKKRERKLAEKLCGTKEGKIQYYALKDLLQERELRDFVKQDSSGRMEWLKRYWSLKDPTPTTLKNEWKDEFDSRVDFVITNFHSVFGERPWDDRGDVLLKLGPPEERVLSADSSWKARRERYKGPVTNTEEEFYKTGCEVWTYFIRGKEVNFQFEDMKFTGNFTLVPYKSANRIENLDYISKFNLQFAELDQSLAVYRHDYEGEPLDFAWEAVKFRHINGIYEILVNVGIPTDKLARDSLDQVHYEQQIAVKNDKGEIVRCDSVKVHQKIPDSSDNLLIDQKSFLLRPGLYMIALETRDQISKKVGLYKDDLFLPAYTLSNSNPGLTVSRPVLSSKVVEAQPGEETKKFFFNGYLIYPNPGHIFFKEQEDEIRAYFEIYDLSSRNDTVRFSTISYIINYDQSNLDSILVTCDTVTTVRAAFTPGIAVYQILPLLSSRGPHLEPGDYIWRIDIIDLNAPHKPESLVNRLRIKKERGVRKL